MTIRAAAPLDAATALPDALVLQQLKLDSLDATAEALRLTALQFVEKRSRVSLQRRAWVATLDAFGDGVITLPREPVSEVTRVTYVDQLGGPRDAAGLWRLIDDRLAPAVSGWWPTTSRGAGVVKIEFVAGYVDLAVGAPTLRTAALLLIQHLYDGGNLDEVPKSFMMLCDIDRVPVAG
ncbi:head-tail connector protein [Sphingomonas sp. S2-65]|uniref:head-tail connector protein n=1 Tax=Sphingomonas sp. S2-65 TaxID=2903960 RepID=UPI001F3DC12E|nr:hypothetical protein [Sphingomonas sp. S2-65]UYY60278.1 hypothetical protein LZ586_08540 [Sphingomonas sp. S2-65]